MDPGIVMEEILVYIVTDDSVWLLMEKLDAENSLADEIIA